VEQLIALSSRCHLISLLGNHEEMLLNALESKSEYRYWLKFGGEQTLRSYAPHSMVLDVIPPAHIRFIRACRDYYETETHLFVHANYDPELSMDKIGGTKLRWELLDLDRLRPHCSGKTVVVGHTPQENGNVLDLGFLICIDTDCCRGGRLTALRIDSGDFIQTSREEAVRESSE
jgi:serine/threonine protein phosphatase 1